MSDLQQRSSVSSGSGRCWVRMPTGESYGPADEATLLEWARQGRVPADAMLISENGDVPPMPVTRHPRLAQIVGAPPTVPGTLKAMDEGDATGGLIPYKNPAALIGYYTSIVSLVPVLALLLGPVAIVLGILGLKAKKQNPRVRGTAHCIVAIVLGGLTTLGNAGVLVALLLMP